MLRTLSYKYVAFSTGRDPEMLFDLEQDPGEKNNLAYAAARRHVLDEHRELLRQWCVQVDDDFVVPIHDN
jgi:hypothetical protein